MFLLKRTTEKIIVICLSILISTTGFLMVYASGDGSKSVYSFEIDLTIGDYYLTTNEYSKLLGVALVDQDGKHVDYAVPAMIEERDIFPLNTKIRDIFVDKAGRYTVLCTFEKVGANTATLAPYIKKVWSNQDDMRHLWSKSYYDESLVSVVSNGAEYVNMAKYAPDIVCFSQVTTMLNRTGRILDSEDIVIQRRDFADLLVKVNNDLMQAGYRLVIYDGYRTKASTKALYDFTIADLSKPYDQRLYKAFTIDTYGWYIVHPKSPLDRHGKGTAADVTLLDMATGKLINMPSRVNTMNETAWIEYTKKHSVPYQHLWNSMKKHGISTYFREWYHIFKDAPVEKAFPALGLRAAFYTQTAPIQAISDGAKQALIQLIDKVDIHQSLSLQNKPVQLKTLVGVLSDIFIHYGYSVDDQLLSQIDNHDRQIRLEDSAVIITRMLAYFDLQLQKSQQINVFSDDAELDSAYKSAIYELASYGLISPNQANKIKTSALLNNDDLYQMLYQLSQKLQDLAEAKEDEQQTEGATTE